MTEEEWLIGNDPYSMFAVIRRIENARRMHLFLCGCCRQVAKLLVDERSRKALQLLEDDADDDTDDEQLRHDAQDMAEVALQAAPSDAASDAACTVSDVARRHPLEFLFGHLESALAKSKGLNKSAVRWGIADLLRDIFGNPFRPITINPVWLTPTVSNLAQTAYDDRIMPSGELDISCLAVLSDCLEEIGCDDEYILNHLRSAGPHARGCWVIDLLLGKS